MKIRFAKALLISSLVGSAWTVPVWAEHDGEAASEVHDGETNHGHDAHHGGHHDPHFSDINWFTGLIGEKEGVEPGLLWRAPGTPVPLGALFINTAILFFLIGKLGGPAISAGLKTRKERIAGDMQRAAKMKEEAEQQLAEYEGKLAEMAREMERIKKQMAEQAEHERERVLEEAKARAASIEEEAKMMVAQQLSQARQEATKKAVESAIRAAREEIQKGLASSDQERLAAQLLSSVESHFSSQEVRS